MLSTGKLPLGGLPRNSVVGITDHQDMTLAVYCGHKATKKKKCLKSLTNQVSFTNKTGEH